MAIPWINRDGDVSEFQGHCCIDAPRKAASAKLIRVAVAAREPQRFAVGTYFFANVMFQALGQCKIKRT